MGQAIDLAILLSEKGGTRRDMDNVFYGTTAAKVHDGPCEALEQWAKGNESPQPLGDFIGDIS